ncbi:MAG: cytochrome-c peroxidase [Gammaproteobacteria bacterium]|nr:cytochrome-c peroxidase [Gammaproteobacteria bacterium]
MSATCPPSFELSADNACQFRSLYQQYAAPEGYGGLRAPLPKPRDGFSPQEIDLGRYLFFDPILAADAATSCAHCHHPDHGFADGLGQGLGAGATGEGPDRKGGTRLSRGSPGLWNVAFLKHYFLDSRASSLEEQAAGPLLAPNEMASTVDDIEAALNGNATYRALFSEVYPATSGSDVAFADVVRAISAFEASLISLNSRYDRYAHGDENALNPQEIAGHNLFRSFVPRCSQCHTPPLFTNGEIAVIGSPEPRGVVFDIGAEGPSGDADMRGAFKVPSLRNIALTAPYMHSGRFATLEEVINFYNSGRGNAVPPNERLHVHWHISDFELSSTEVEALTAFLMTLTDESMKPEVPPSVPSGLPVVTTQRTALAGATEQGDQR